MVLYWGFLVWGFSMGLQISGKFHFQFLQSLLPFKPELDLCTVTQYQHFSVSLFSLISHKMRSTKIPNKCLWREGWPVRRYVGV